MSQDNVELARQVVDAINGRDLSRLIELTDPKIEWHSFFAAVGEGGVYRGHDGLRRYVGDLDDAWEILRAEVDEVLAVGEVVVFVGRLHYRGQGSGVETESPAGWVQRFRKGKVISFRAFREPEQALGDLGLRGSEGLRRQM